MALTKVRRGGTDTGISDSSDATAITIDSSENVGINSTSPSTYVDGSSGSTLVLESSGTNRGALVFASECTGGEGEILGLINFTDTANSSTNKRGAAIRGVRGSSDTNPFLTFTTANAERMRIDGSGNFYIGNTAFNSNNNGFLVQSNGTSYITATDGLVLELNRKTSDGTVLLVRQDGNAEGSIGVSGSTVSFDGFVGRHESSGIETSVAKGTVVSTIDELDVYLDGDKKGKTRADHPKVKISDTVGDKRVYGVVDTYTAQDKLMVASVGIGSIKVTGACEGGDLLESNGDGTAKVQSDDVIRSKTIGKVTIGDSNTGVKLVSCVLYCG